MEQQAHGQGDAVAGLSSLLPRNQSLLIIAAVVVLSLLAALETQLGILSRGLIDYSLWPDDFLVACGEYTRVRAAEARSPLLNGCSVAVCGMLTLMLCENYWDRLRISWQASSLRGFMSASQASLLDGIDERFRFILLSAAVSLIAFDFILLLADVPFLSGLQPLMLTRFVAIPLWLLRDWLPPRLRSELDGQATAKQAAIQH